MRFAAAAALLALVLAGAPDGRTSPALASDATAAEAVATLSAPGLL